DADHIVIGQVLKTGDTKAAATAAPAATALTTYTVKRGDSLSGIAKRNHTTVSALLKLNGLKNADHVVIGQTLKLVAAAPAPAPAKPATPALKPISSVHAIAGGLPPTHIVTKGENAAKIAKNFKVSTTSLSK